MTTHEDDNNSTFCKACGCRITKGKCQHGVTLPPIFCTMAEEHEARCSIPVTWKVGDIVTADGNIGKVAYVYTNGFTMVEIGGEPITGGAFSNNSTFGNDKIVKIKNGC